MVDPSLHAAIATVPAGAWAVGVSGGADSVALLSLLRERGDLSLHVAHLDHQTRGEESTADAAFVHDLSSKWNLPCTIALREEIEKDLPEISANASARYRAGRMALFRRVVDRHRLQGVILAHHADDQAETVLQRMLRGSSGIGLGGMSPRASVGGLVILRPLLGVGRRQLRDYLLGMGQTWREDQSNQSPRYMRNRIRQVLAEHPALVGGLLELACACAALREWSRAQAPALQGSFPVEQLQGLPSLLAQTAARRWLVDRGSPIDDLSTGVVDRLIRMAGDAATPPRAHFPGGMLVSRRAGMIQRVDEPHSSGS